MNRTRRCLLCPDTANQTFKQLARSTFEKAVGQRKQLSLCDDEQLLSSVQSVLPTYSIDNLSAPTSVCISCRQLVVSKRTFDALRLAAVQALISSGTQPRHGVCSDTCNICRGMRGKVKLRPAIKTPKTEISPPRRAKRPGQNVHKRLTSPTSPTPDLTLDDIHEMHRGMPANVSTRAMSSASARQRNRAKLGKSPVSAPSKTAYQQHEYHLNKAFRDDFRSLRHDECSDGAAQVIVDVAESVRKWIWIRHEQVRFLPFRGSSLCVNS